MTPSSSSVPGTRRRRCAAGLLSATLVAAILGVGGTAMAADVPAPDATPDPTSATPTPEPAPTSDPVTEPTAEEPAPVPDEIVATTDDEPVEPRPEPSTTPTADEPAAEPAPASRRAADIVHTGTRYDGPDGVVYYVPDRIAVGEPIRVSGTGWTTTAGDAGSVIALKLDDGAVSTTLDVAHPVTGAIQGNRTIIGMVRADADGAWEISVPFPTPATATTTWAAGQTHSVRLLTGSLDGDVQRSQTASFAVGDDEAATSPPAWPHQTVTYTDPASGAVATAWIESAVAAGDVSTIRVKGAGWTDTAGTRGSTVALKLNSGVSTQYTRTGVDVVQHPTASGDDTIWALLAKDDGTDRPHVFPIDDTGAFEIAVDAPKALLTGQYLTAQLQSGRFLTGDVQRTVASAPIVVGGVPWVDPGAEEQVTCVPRTAVPTVTVESASASVGGLLHVTGSGWCHPAANGGGSVVAFKIDEGAYSRLTTAVHQNRTIWAVAAADPATGELDTQIQLPDGTTAGANGSDPAFPTGAHTLRALSGSLKPGDTVRTVETGEFVVGSYRPNGLPPLLESREDLTGDTKRGLSVSRTSSELTASVRGAAKDDWVFLTVYASDGSPRYPWGATWFRADADGTVHAPLAGVTLPAGTSKISAQSGNQGEVGRLLGWDDLTIQARDTTPDLGDDDTVYRPAPRPARTVTVPPAGAPAVMASAPAPGVPLGVPGAPFADASGFTAANAGGLTGVQDGTVVTITIPSAVPGDWVYLYAYSEPLGVGWIEVDAQRQIAVDVANLPAGDHHLALLDRDGDLLGWTRATVDAVPQAAVPPVTTVAPALTRAAPAEARDLLGRADWWLLGGGLAVLLVSAGGAAALLRRSGPAASEGDLA